MIKRKKNIEALSASQNELNQWSLQIKIWGSRGSIPAPPTPQDLERHILRLFLQFVDTNTGDKRALSSFIEGLSRHELGGYGGNTTCVEVNSPSQQIIIDGGSGIRGLGNQMMAGPCGKGKGEAHVFLTHFHWDHITGLPFFTPIFIPGNVIHFYAVQPDLQDTFNVLFKKPYFPISLKDLGATIQYHALEPRKAVQLGNLSVTPYQLDHPDPCWGYRVESAGKVYAHCVDTECIRVTREQLGADLPLYQGVDLMLFDAQYTLMEAIEKVNWGHAAASLGIDLAVRERIKRMIFIHHNPASSNESIAAAEDQARNYHRSQIKTAHRAEHLIHSVEWCFGHEGMVLEI